MTRKDYALIAKAINRARGYETLEREHKAGYVELTAEILAAMLEDDNPRFDKARFIEACGFIP